MEKLDAIIKIGEFLGVAIAAGWLSRILTIRERVRQEKAGADKAETEVKSDQIENIRKTVEEVYKPIIEDLKKTAAEARQEAAEARRTADEALDKAEALERENRELRRENAELRDAIRVLQPDLVPSRRSENASRQARGSNGQFVKEDRDHGND